MINRIYNRCLKSQTPAAKNAMLGVRSRGLTEVAAPVCRLAAGVVEEEVAEAALTYEYEVWVTTEMPPSGRVEVCVEVTSTEDGEEEALVVLVSSSPSEVLLDALFVDVAVEKVESADVVGSVRGC